MSRCIKLTPKGSNALRSDELQGVDLLIIEVASRTSNITPKHLSELTAQLVEHYGAPEAAIEALRCGAVRLDKAPS